MDGELWLGRGRFEDTSGTVRAGDANDPAWRRMRFMVFDLPGDPGTFTERVLHMRSLLDAASVAWLRPVAQYRARDAAESSEEQRVGNAGVSPCSSRWESYHKKKQ